MTATTYASVLDRLTEGLTLPDGCDQWAFRTVRPDLRSSRGFRWPFPGQWAEAPGPIIASNFGACPYTPGDGICVATTYHGMASGGVPAQTVLLTPYATTDVLGGIREDGKLRVRRAFVFDVHDGDQVLRDHGTGANLYGANLYGANLTGANLSGADLSRADLSRADLYGADLSGADLYGADLYGANLYGANLSGAHLSGAHLSGANLYGAHLSGANLSGADLSRADLYGADLSGADLYGADLYGANLSGANLTGANLTGAINIPANAVGGTR